MALSPFALAGLPNHKLLERLRELLACEAGLEADLLVHVGEVDARGLYAPQGYPSLYAYLTEGLHLSESVAYHRIQVARAARKFPALLERIRAGELHLSGALVLVPVLTPANCAELLDRARHKSKRAIEEMVRDLAPRPDARALVRALPSPAAPPEPQACATSRPEPAMPVARVPPRSCPAPEPLGNARYHVQFTASAETRDKLREARSLLRHQIPDGDLAQLFDRALDALIREARRAKFAETDRPRERDEASDSAELPASRHIPAEIRRAVAARDGGRCAFVARDGRRCAPRDALEFHHLEPFARAKRHRVESITLRCRAHNRYAAVLDYGAEWMSRFRRPDRESASTSTVPGDSSRGLCARAQADHSPCEDAGPDGTPGGP
jgi:hypothetical protein